MTAFTYSIALVIASQVTYQLAVKAMPRQSHPFGVLIIVYGLAIVGCIVLSPLAGRPLAFADFRRLLSWPTIAALAQALRPSPYSVMKNASATTGNARPTHAASIHPPSAYDQPPSAEPTAPPMKKAAT